MNDYVVINDGYKSLSYNVTNICNKPRIAINKKNDEIFYIPLISSKSGKKCRINNSCLAEYNSYAQLIRETVTTGTTYLTRSSTSASNTYTTTKNSYRTYLESVETMIPPTDHKASWISGAFDFYYIKAPDGLHTKNYPVFNNIFVTQNGSYKSLYFTGLASSASWYSAGKSTSFGDKFSYTVSIANQRRSYGHQFDGYTGCGLYTVKYKQQTTFNQFPILVQSTTSNSSYTTSVYSTNYQTRSSISDTLYGTEERSSTKISFSWD